MSLKDKTRAETMARLYRDGYTLKEIGQQFGISRQRVQQLLDAHGVKRRPPRAVLHRERAERQGAEIVARFRATADVGRVASELGLPRRAVLEVLRERLHRPELYRPKPSIKQFTDEEIVACLRAAAQAFDGTLTGADYAAIAAGRRLPDGRRWPSRPTVDYRFGGWLSATAAAGVRPGRRRAGGPSRRFTPERCRAAVREAAKALGHPPSSVEYEHFARTRCGALPGVRTVQKNLGPWREVLLGAGL